MLNVVNFGGGSYVLYAEIGDDGEIEVDPEPYSDNFARPARLLPVEAKALVAAIDLIGEHIPEGSLASAREKIVAALGEDPVARGPAGRHRRRRRLARRARRLDARSPTRRLLRARVLQGERGRVLQAGRRALRADQRPRGLVRASLRPRAKDAVRHFRLDRIKTRACRARRASSRARRSIRPPTSRAGRAPARCRPRAWRASGSRPSARAGRARSAAWSRSSPTARSSWSWASPATDWLVREILKEAGDAAVLEPEDAREAVLDAAKRLA